ncbi:serine/threonine-protein kinase LATS2-like isoform X2 [Watersipora subatra]|uniref:serine/threonine-protein kinase LATS2-like isoform X2 n=1 Tax=Watersipora subatra TaxID=2589382 RepID=UPI00355C269F
MAEQSNSQGYSSSLSTVSSNLSDSAANLQANLSTQGRRPIIIRDAQQRAMLHNIRDSLAHLQKASLPSPGSDTSGASGTSTPNKESLSGKDGTSKRNVNYTSTALAEIRKSLQTFKKDEHSKDTDLELEATAKVNVKELIQQICPAENRNGLQSKFGGLVGPPAIHSPGGKTEKPKNEILATNNGAISPPPPLPPRSRVLTTPPPPLPPREAISQARGSVRGASPSQAASTVTSHSAANTVPSATPPSSLEQLAEQTGLSTQEIHSILLQHSQSLQSTKRTQPVPPPPAQMSPSYHEQYTPNMDHRQHQPTAINMSSQYPIAVPHHREPASPIQNGNQPPPPNYSSPHLVNAATPPPPYNTHHQPSPASSITSGSSNDYLLVSYGGYPPPHTGEYRTPPYPESPSSGSSSPASLQGSHYLHPAAQHMHPAPTPIQAWETKQTSVITHSARSQVLPRPHLHTDPQFQITGHPTFQVTARNSQSTHNTGPLRRIPDHQIQFKFSTEASPMDPPHLRRKGSLETRSDSPVSRTTNQSPLSMISTASTNSDALPDRPPPPYPGNGRQANNNGLAGRGAINVDLSEASEPEQSETESESGRTHRCTSPIPQLRIDAETKEEDKVWTKLKHYSPAAFKFYMEQHIENVLKQHKERVSRRIQLEREMSKVELSDEAKDQVRKMLKQKETNYLRLKRAKMNRSMFDVIKTLGIGAFGTVSLVRKKVLEKGDFEGEQLYAMKTLRKVDVVRRNQVAHVKAERDMLAEAELEWVTKLFYSFQDKENLYFIMEYIPGGDLMALLIKMGIFEEPLARFYIAELVLAIESVHKMGFIHRDIKPDNVLIDKDGHLKLTDFGLCTGFRWTHNSKYYQEGGHNRQDSMDPQDVSSDPCHCPKELPKILEKRRRKEQQRCLAHSLVGTPNYIAPEVLLRSGYTRSCDWWSVGVILYEMLVGQPPFFANTPKETQIKVVNWKTTLNIPPESGLSLAAQDLILRLCTGPLDRIGTNGAEEIKAHSFFKKTEFTDLRKQKAPYKPVIKYATDTSNFDEVEEQDQPPYQTDDLRQRGHFPEHAFSEFTFRRFFDDGAPARPLSIAESLSYFKSLSLSNNNINNSSHPAQSNAQAEERTPQNSYHEVEESRSSSGNPVYV